MKVDGPKSTQAAGGAKKASAAKRSGGASFSSALQADGAHADDAIDGASAALGNSPVAAVDALLALQEIDVAGDALSGEKKRKALKWGETLLDGLDEIRNGLLLGAIPVDRLEKLASAASLSIDTGGDPKLTTILRDIELRARVEIAKYRSQ